MRLIDADVLYDEIEYDALFSVQTAKDIVELIFSAPTVDAVEVVRCKDCSWCRETDEHEKMYLIEGVLICTNCEASDDCWNPVFPNHFCSYGERRGD